MQLYGNDAAPMACCGTAKASLTGICVLQLGYTIQSC